MSQFQYQVAVVRLIIVDDRGRILLLQRSRSEHSSGEWCLPGGKVDYGKTIESSISQELEEETSLSLRNARFLFYQDSLPIVEGGMHCINFYFFCEVEGEVVLNHESIDFAWIEPENLASYPAITAMLCSPVIA